VEGGDISVQAAQRGDSRRLIPTPLSAQRVFSERR